MIDRLGTFLGLVIVLAAGCGFYLHYGAMPFFIGAFAFAVTAAVVVVGLVSAGGSSFRKYEGSPLVTSSVRKEQTPLSV